MSMTYTFFLLGCLNLPGFAAVKECGQHIQVAESQLCSQGEILAAPDFLQLVGCCHCFSDPAVQFMVNVCTIIDVATDV